MVSSVLTEIDIKLQETHPDLTSDIFEELIGLVTLMAEDGVQKLPVANQYKRFFEHPGVADLVRQNASDFIYEDGCVVLTGKAGASGNDEINIDEINELEDEGEG